MQLVTNYLDKLESYLPEELQQEVREELEASIYGQIEDKQESLQRELTPTEQEEILQNIGHPMRVASAYLPHQELVGKEFFPAYKKALEIALVIMTLVIFAFSIPGIFSDRSLIGSAIAIFANLVDNGLSVFAIVTIIFYILQTSNVKPEEIYAWSPSDLRTTSKKLSLNRLETIFEIVFYTLFLAWWNDALAWPGQIFNHDIIVQVSLSAEWQKVFMSINVIVGLSIAVSLHKFIIAGWNKFSLAADMALALASFVVLYQIFQFETYTVFDKSLPDNFDQEFIQSTIDNTVYGIIAFVAVICAWDIYGNFRKIISYKK